jgi:hypothetical protein
MTHRGTPLHLRLACAMALALALVPGVARAVGPSLAAQQIMAEGFEGATPANLALDWVTPAPATPYPAYWGPITDQKHTGSRGLWCAGLIPESASTAAWTTFNHKYPDFTAGLATFTLPELADYYSTTLDYWYRMPTIGSADGDSFVVEWSSAVGGALWDYRTGWPLTSAWTHVTLNMTVPTPGGQSRPVNLSRTPGQVRFRFIDDTSVYNESPTTGEGPTIDDVTVSGYKYGPVRSLHTTAVGAGSVSLAWTRPARSTAIGATDDTRTITYHVWRSRDVQPYSWTEVGTGVTGTSITDASPRGGTWRYIVQAWDPVPGTGYGELETSAGVSVFVDKAPESTIVFDPASPVLGDLYAVPPAVTVTREFEGTTYWRWGSGAFVPNTALSFTVPAPITTDATRTLEVYSTNTLNTAETPHKTATYALKVYHLQYNAGAGGTLGGAASQPVFYGASGTAVTANPNAGYHFVRWSDGLLTAARTDGGVTDDLVVSAEFAINTYRLRYSAGTGGTISGDASQTVVHAGTGTAVTAIAGPGRYFVTWSDGVTTATRTEAPVVADVTVSATFAIDTFRLHYAAGTGGTISGTASQTVSYGGGGTTVTATPSSGHRFLGWSDGVLTADRTDSNVVASIDVTALFAVDAPNVYTLTYTAGAGGSIVGPSPQSVTAGGSGAQVTATPSVGYHFVAWSDGAIAVARTDTGVVNDLTVSASFAANTYQLKYSAGTGGTISGTASQTVNHSGSGTAVTAVPGVGHHFVSWSDGKTTPARTDAGVTANATYTAVFALDTYHLHYTAGAGGTISGTASQTISYGSSGTAVTAVPNAGSHFVAWDDGLATPTRTDSGAGLSVAAVFAVGVADATPPITTWPAWSATYVTKASIVLTATDNYGSGVDHTFWEFDGGNTTTGTVLSTGKAGLHTLSFWSVDKAGNREATNTVSFTVLIATKLSITSDHTSVVHKHAVKLSGIITPNVYAGTHVEVWVLRPGSHAYTRLTTRSSYSYHHWSYTYYPATKGTWYFKVKLPQTSKYAKSESAYRRITVK